MPPALAQTPAPPPPPPPPPPPAVVARGFGQVPWQQMWLPCLSLLVVGCSVLIVVRILNEHAEEPPKPPGTRGDVPGEFLGRVAVVRAPVWGSYVRASVHGPETPGSPRRDRTSLLHLG